ncbi:MAG TPA: alpha-galactosidase [Candidatus Hydrogenedentes bacterium]|nr:alpha-galactosidase [Candidatus Hydrogenedentota bacterium]HQH53357.1 alpha-galactosidase [Candidatus Hydrogenedentota bacterium]
MRARWLLIRFTLLTTCFLPRASAVSPTADEMTEAQHWIAAALAGGLTAKPMFSFMYDGKPVSELLTACEFKQGKRQLDDQRAERTLTWTDSKTGLEVRCVSVEYADFPVVEWTIYLRNAGKEDTPLIENIQALDARWERSDGGEFVLRGIKGDYCVPDSYEPYEMTLGPNATQKLAPEGGRPTNKAFPCYNLAMPGGGVIIAVGWPGQWATSFTRNSEKGIQVVAGQELTHLRLKPGEEIRTPLIALLFWKGSDPVRAQNLWRRWMLAHNVPKFGGKPVPPILIMCTTDFYPGLRSNAADEIKYAEVYINEGVKLDYWVIDAGWYLCDGPGWPKVGTWEPDPDRYPKGMKEVSDYVHSKGVRFSVWFEPERVSPDTWLANTHPEWLFNGKNIGANISLLNLGNAEARQWLTNHIDRMLTEQGIDLYRQDFNMDPLAFWRSGDSPDRQGVSENLHVQGYLAYWDELIRRHPGMPIDSCASGGRRNDLETLRRGLPLLRSDYLGEPFYTQQCQTYGLVQWVPYFGSGAPYKDDYTARSVWCPRFALARSAPRQEGLDWTDYLRMVKEWRSVSDYLLGDFYPLTPYSLEDTVWMAWQFDCPERGEGMVQVFRRANSTDESIRVKLHGVEASALYTLTNLDTASMTDTTGTELIGQGVSIVLHDKPGSAVLIYRKKP